MKNESSDKLKNERNFKLLRRAINDNQIDLIRHALIFSKNIFNINYQDYIDRKTLLITASEFGNLEVVKYLLTNPELQEHSNINIEDNYGANALSYACRGGYLEVVKYLLTSPELQEHSNIYHKNKLGYNPLIYAAYSERYDICQFFIITMDMKLDKDVINWLSGENDEERIYDNVLKIINSRELYKDLNTYITSNSNNIKKIKI